VSGQLNSPAALPPIQLDRILNGTQNRSGRRGGENNPSSQIMALGSTKLLTEMSIRDLPGGKGRPERKADSLTAICEPIV
jgi:hypothetical protein